MWLLGMVELQCSREIEKTGSQFLLQSLHISSFLFPCLNLISMWFSLEQQQRVMKPSRFVRHAHSNKTAAAQNKKHNRIHGQNQTQSISANPSYNSVQATPSRGSHMPALFLRCSGSHDEKAIGGTGVFLPHYYIGNGSKHKQKPGTKFLQLFSSVFSAQQLYILQSERIHPTFPVVLKTL